MQRLGKRVSCPASVNCRASFSTRLYVNNNTFYLIINIFSLIFFLVLTRTLQKCNYQYIIQYIMMDITYKYSIHAVSILILVGFHSELVGQTLKLITRSYASRKHESIYIQNEYSNLFYCGYDGTLLTIYRYFILGSLWNL